MRAGSAQSKRFREGKARRERFVTLLQNGVPLREAVLQAGWAGMGSYQQARVRDKDWAREVDMAKTAGRQFRQKLAEPDELDDPSDTNLDVSLAFQRFVRDYFPDRQVHKAHQLQIVRELHDLQPRDIVLVLVWPEAGKTATIEDYICRHLAKEDPNHRFRVVSEGQDLSKRIVGTCVRRFTDIGAYPAFIGKYGPFYEKGQERKGRPWTADQITILNNAGGERDRNLVATGWTGASYGSRIDTLILDDLQSQRNMSQAEEIFSRIRGTFFNRGLEMKTLIVGTRIASGDFYERMLDAGLITKMVRLAAANPDGEPTVPTFWDRNVFHTSNPTKKTGPCCSGFRDDTCPRDGRKLTPREFMELIRHQSGEDVWWSAYQQSPAANALTTFGALIDRCYDFDRKVGQMPAHV